MLLTVVVELLTNIVSREPFDCDDALPDVEYSSVMSGATNTLSPVMQDPWTF